MQTSWVIQVDVTDLVEVCVTARETLFLKDVSSEEHTLKIVSSVWYFRLHLAGFIVFPVCSISPVSH